MNPISAIGVPTTFAPAALAPAGPGKGAAAAGGPSFENFLLKSIEEVNSMQRAADQSVEELATGGDVSPAEVLSAVQKADIAFRLLMQVRNKIVQAFQEIQNIRI